MIVISTKDNVDKKKTYEIQEQYLMRPAMLVGFWNSLDLVAQQGEEVAPNMCTNIWNSVLYITVLYTTWRRFIKAPAQPWEC